jgi:hypothetical protein
MTYSFATDASLKRLIITGTDASVVKEVYIIPLTTLMMTAIYDNNNIIFSTDSTAILTVAVADTEYSTTADFVVGLRKLLP